MVENFVVGDNVWVLLPWWVQVHDDVEPYVKATVVKVSDDAVTVEYETADYGKQSFVVNELDRISMEKA